MKFTVQIAILSSMLAAYGAQARVIYGEDNRVEVFEASAHQQNLARSSAVMISSKKLRRNPRKPGVVQIDQTSLSEWLENPSSESHPTDLKNFISMSTARIVLKENVKFCQEVRYTSQPSVGACSGFLIAPDLLLTAGHCGGLPTFCSDYQWVFGYQIDPFTKKAGLNVDEQDVYGCKKIIASTLSLGLGLDYTLVQLDRKVTNREPLEIQNDNKIQLNTPLFVIGSPSGLPLKVAGGAKVRKNDHPFFFVSTLDTFSGNSGSGVFNALTGKVEGILVSGEVDFQMNKSPRCLGVKVCKEDECRGENVTRLTAVPEIGVQAALNKAAFAGDMVNLNKILKLNLWINFNTKDGETALMKAVQGGKNVAVAALITRGADVNVQDALGNSALHHLGKNLNNKISKVLETLVSARANLELKNKSGETPLLVAGRKLNLVGAKLLIAVGANKNAVNAKGENVVAAFNRAGDLKAVQELKALGVNASTNMVTRR
jgi:hypothetical protein